MLAALSLALFPENGDICCCCLPYPMLHVQKLGPSLLLPAQGVLRNQFQFETTETGTDPKLSLSETKRQFLFFRFYTETESFDAQCDREHILFHFFWVYFGLFQNSLFQFRFYTETESFNVSIEPKQTEDQTEQFDREHILVLFRKIQVFFGLFQFVSKQFCLFQLFLYKFETLKQTGCCCLPYPWFHVQKMRTFVAAVCLILCFMSRK